MWVIIAVVEFRGRGGVLAVFCTAAGLDSENDRTRFRQVKWQHQENPRTLYYRVQHAAGRWLHPTDKTREEIFDTIVLEQYLEALPSTTRNWVRQHPGLTNEIAVDLACAYHRGPDFRATASRIPPLPPVRPTITKSITHRSARYMVQNILSRPVQRLPAIQAQAPSVISVQNGAILPDIAHTERRPRNTWKLV
ncbi:hypothetical protein NDU88_007974 [Pleurodeles waltl]|uniref:SCAN box domain-containing protein n=1 Tax=Pleurodeles waltl TaxID=8319 RepID=A0AAV7NWD9_PLEWA|nr:hypothetical protein NDU88_007974 [Pleurodeles waltl]